MRGPVALRPTRLGYLGISCFSHSGGYGFSFNFPDDEWGGVPLSYAYRPFWHSLVKCCSHILPVFIVGLSRWLVGILHSRCGSVGFHAAQVYFVSPWFAFSLSWWPLMWTGVVSFSEAYFIIFYSSWCFSVSCSRNLPLAQGHEDILSCFLVEALWFYLSA